MMDPNFFTEYAKNEIDFQADDFKFMVNLFASVCWSINSVYCVQNERFKKAGGESLWFARVCGFDGRILACTSKHSEDLELRKGIKFFIAWYKQTCADLKESGSQKESPLVPQDQVQWMTLQKWIW